MAVIEEVHISEEVYELKAQANRKFAAKDYDGALADYLDLLAQLPARPPSRPVQEPSPSGDEQNFDTDRSENEELSEQSNSTRSDKEATEETAEEEDEVRRMRSVVYANVAAVHLRLSQPREAVKAANESLADDPRYVKALYRRAQANEALGSWAGLSAALQDHQSLLTNPALPASTKPDVQSAITRLEPKVKQAAESEKDEMIAKLKGLGDSILGNFGLSTNNFKFTQQPSGGYSMNFVR